MPAAAEQCEEGRERRMLLEKLKEEENFTNHEKEVARYILDHLDKVPGMSSGELARASFTSKATVSVSARRRGFPVIRNFV